MVQVRGDAWIRGSRDPILECLNLELQNLLISTFHG